MRAARRASSVSASSTSSTASSTQRQGFCWPSSSAKNADRRSASPAVAACRAATSSRPAPLAALQHGNAQPLQLLERQRGGGALERRHVDGDHATARRIPAVAEAVQPRLIGAVEEPARRPAAAGPRRRACGRSTPSAVAGSGIGRPPRTAPGASRGAGAGVEQRPQQRHQLRRQRQLAVGRCRSPRSSRTAGRGRPATPARPGCRRRSGPAPARRRQRGGVHQPPLPEAHPGEVRGAPVGERRQQRDRAGPPR